MFHRLFSWLLSLLYLAGAGLFGWPKPARGSALDISKFTLVWSDEFGGDALDRTKWAGHGGDAGPRRDGWWDIRLAAVGGGLLRIPSVYLAEGLGGAPAGYYSCGIDTRDRYEQRYGYFEIRCQLPKGQGLWSAFWLLNDGMRNVDGSGRDGAEIDVYESPYFQESCRFRRDAVSSAIHYDGYGEGLRSAAVGTYRVSQPYDSFHTYGLEWNADGYIFYVDGRESGRSDFGGASQEPEYLILSVEHQTGGWAGDIRQNTEPATDFIVDYVRAYQYK
ncbi:MAG: glycoside hydrolase family 16 protein [Oscillospiraceae bacterium]|jgi:beta-glucanase (GH16 family)|nr:glycoside hydrolase family 16 protein [Oscillospiraceae bacterium]